MFLYVSAAPVFITQHLKLAADQFGWQFVPSVAGIFLGARGKQTGWQTLCMEAGEYRFLLPYWSVLI
jgi:hypothetical protein